MQSTQGSVEMGEGVPRLSVVVTCYNLGAYLEEALESVAFHFTKEQVEVIVVDDGSTDPMTVAVLDRLDTQRYRVIRQANMGLAKARNNGIRASRGSYIIPMDADNRLRRTMIDTTIAVLDVEPAVDVVYGDAEYFGGRTGRWRLGDHDLSQLLERNRVDACAGFRRSLWERLGGYDEHMPVMGYEDWDLWLRATVIGAHFHHVEEVFFDYRVRPGSMLVNAMENKAVLEAYIFGKPELAFLATLRKEHIALRKQQADRREPTGRELLSLLTDRLWSRLRGKHGPLPKN